MKVQVEGARGRSGRLYVRIAMAQQADARAGGTPSTLDSEAPPTPSQTQEGLKGMQGEAGGRRAIDMPHTHALSHLALDGHGGAQASAREAHSGLHSGE